MGKDVGISVSTCGYADTFTFATLHICKFRVTDNECKMYIDFLKPIHARDVICIGPSPLLF